MTLPVCNADFEWRSDVDLRVHGQSRYFASPHSRPLMLAYSFDDSTPKVWLFGEPCPQDLYEHVVAGGLIKAWNAAFERRCFTWLAAHKGWPAPRLEQFRCTMSEALAMGLPRKLEKAAVAMGLAEQKDKRGADLIRFFCTPRRRKKDETAPDPLFNEPEDHPAKYAEFIEYCQQDVRTERAMGARLFPLSDYEQSIYELGERINDRGVRIDRTSVVAAIDLVDREKSLLDRSMSALTGGAVPACSNVAKLTIWLGERGVAMDGVAKDAIRTVLKTDDLPADCRQALMLRQDAAKTSTAKLGAFLKRMDSDDRLRNAFVYHAAGTGRFSSVGVNINNLPRPRPIFEDAALDITTLFDVFRQNDPELLRFLYGDELGRPLHLVSDAVRGFIYAAPGHDFMAVDYSGIEGAVAAWLVDEKWKLKAMAEIIADPSLPDLYRRAAAHIMNTTTDIVTKKHPLRQSVGKVSELALGFGGGVAAFVSMAANYNVDLDSLYEPVWDAAPDELRTRAERRYARCLKARDKVKTDVLSRQAWLACELIKHGWRGQHPAFVTGWAALGDAIRDAIRYPGKQFTACKVTYLVAHGFLWGRLPSGRCLAYGAPKLKDQVYAVLQNTDGSWPEDSEIVDRETAERLSLRGRAKVGNATTPAATALGFDATTQRYTRFALYDGLAFENAVQGVARDILVQGMTAVEAAGCPVVLHCYDEVVAEVPIGFGSLDEFEDILRRLPEWAAGLPLDAHGWAGKRYRK